MTNEQAMLLACGWTTDEDVRLLQLFPDVFFMDITFGTNNELRPLFKLCGIDANRQNFTGVNFFLPSKKRWVFHFLINEGIPLLLGNQVTLPCTCPIRRLLYVMNNLFCYMGKLCMYATNKLNILPTFYYISSPLLYIR